MQKGKRAALALGIAILLGAACLWLCRCFFYNPYNVHARRAALETMSEKYGREFALRSVTFGTQETGPGKYVHLWTFDLEDDAGRPCQAFVRCYGLVKTGDGNAHAPDYFTAVDDTYGQLRLEERLADTIDLRPYRLQKGSDPGRAVWEDYRFACAENGEAEIAALLTEIYFAEAEISAWGCVRCAVCGEAGETLFSYDRRNVTRALQEQGVEATREAVYGFLMRALQGDGR